MVRVVATASMAPAPPRAWPVTPLIEVTGGPGEPKTFSMAWASARSLSGVEVPWALMWPMSRRRDAGVGQGQLHAGGGAVAPGGGGGDVVGVGRRARAEDLGVDAGPAPAGVVEVLEDERAAALGDDEAVAADVEGPGHSRRSTAPSCW